MAKKRNPHVGGNVMDTIRKLKARDPEFARLYDEEYGRLQVARRVKALRERRKLSQKQLAVRAGTKQPAIARLESGQVMPRLDLLQKIAAALGMVVDFRFVPARRQRKLVG